ncbi:hypothetical protein HU200_023667 [Digitaria exilis]|uniref:F-box domain-containing protein n=1 Tax=Digitaria exilis TaxID=1010633 RepID=A0A835C4Y6_9POAL|nr:hypothetical protein HU200_023667 [Digitaria exilis]
MERPDLKSAESSRDIPTEILQDILLRLPTRDVIRSSSVSKLWCSIVTDPSFRKLHAATSDVAEPEVRLVSVNSEPGRRDEARVFNLSSSGNNNKDMLSIPPGYSLTSVCNGFLCFAIDYDHAPVFVCNPVTGETLEFHPMHSTPPPVHIDGDLFLFVPVERRVPERTARMLVLDVSAETRCLYSLPYNYHEGYDPSWDMLADGFDLKGQMCLAVNVIYPRRKLQLWVMRPRRELRLEENNDDKLYWVLRYSFDLGDDSFTLGVPRGAWLDQAQMLCYRHGNYSYKHDTTGYSSWFHVGSLLFFDQIVELPETPSPSRSSSHSTWKPSCQWDILGGYRPTLLSPLTFAPPPSQDEKAKKQLFEYTLLRAL